MTVNYQQRFVTVDFSTSSFYSDSFQVNRNLISYLQVPATWGSTFITFQGSVDGSTFANLYSVSGNAFVVTVNSTSGKIIPLDQTVFSGIKFLQVTSGKIGSEVLQTSPQTIGIGLGRYLTDNRAGVSQNTSFNFGGSGKIF